MTTSLRIYVLYPFWGSFSVKAIDYRGSLLNVSARSVRQAYALAFADQWIAADDPTLIGIVSTCSTETGTRLWCGCTGHSVTGGHVSHGDGIRALRKAIAAHDCPRPPNDLLSRLRRYRQ